MMKRSAGMIGVLALAACDRAPGTTVAPQSPAAGHAMMAKVPTNAFIGRWTGPEGLYLEVLADGGPFSGRYTIANRYTLDDEGHFTGLASMDTIVFTRGGKPVTIRAGSGDATGMKWLAGKRDCLILGPHEGYCRD